MLGPKPGPGSSGLKSALDVGDTGCSRGRSNEPPLSSDVSDVLNRIMRGDGQAKAWLYDTYSRRLFRRLRSRYARGERLDAEELLHDAFLFYLQHDARVLASFLERTPREERTEVRLETYLWDLACGVASNHRRSQRRRQNPLGVTDLERRIDVADPERNSVDRDSLLRLDACLRRSGDRVYLYYKLRYVDGLTPEEIARATGWSRKATYKLKLKLNRAVARCAQRLGLQ